MTTYNWTDQRDKFSRACNGETPFSQTLEQAIINVFEQDPLLVVQAMDRIAAAYTANKITSGWAVLKAEVERASDTKPQRQAIATDAKDKTKAIKRAEQWMTTAGIHFDRESEVEDELFGDFGTLKQWASDDELRTKMLEAWREARPTGVRLERQAYVRAEKWKRTTATLRAQAKPAKPPTITLVRASLFLDTEPEEDPDA